MLRLTAVGTIPSAKDYLEMAAKQVDRLAGLGKIYCYPEGDYLPDLRVCPSQLIVKPDRTRMVRE